MGAQRTVAELTEASMVGAQARAVAQLARVMAGESDRQFVLAFQSLANVVDQFRVATEEETLDHARRTLDRTAEAMVSAGRRGLVKEDAELSGAPEDSVYSDPVFLANAQKLIELSRGNKRIIGGTATSLFPDCVAVGSKTKWCCTGTLVARNVVLTAAHCATGGCAHRVFVGQDVTDVQSGKAIPVASVHVHPKYTGKLNDLAVLILEDDAPIKARGMFEAGTLASVTGMRVVGYGATDVHAMGGYGQRRMVDVPLAQPLAKFGADPAIEFVAGAPFLDRDSCNGDSGGPAYVAVKGRWQLAGVTSRATASSIRKCGDGGIYTFVPKFAQWVRSVPGGRWS